MTEKKPITEKLMKLIAGCNSGVAVLINDNKTVYQTAEQYFAQLESFNTGIDVSEEIMKEMISRDFIVNIHFYPRTSVAFYSVYHYDLEAALDEALECLYNDKPKLRPPEGSASMQEQYQADMDLIRRVLDLQTSDRETQVFAIAHVLQHEQYHPLSRVGSFKRTMMDLKLQENKS